MSTDSPNKIPSHWIDQLRACGSDVAAIVSTWGASKGNNWFPCQTIHLERVLGTPENPEPHLRFRITLQDPETLELVRIDDGESHGPDAIIRGVWEELNEKGSAEHERTGKTGFRGRVQMLDRGGVELNDPEAKRPKLELDGSATQLEDDDQDDDQDDAGDPEIRQLRKEIKRLRDALSQNDQATAKRLQNAAKIDDAVALMCRKRLDWVEVWTERIEDDMRAKLSDSRSDDFWAFMLASLAPKMDMLLDSAGVMMRSWGSHDHRQAEHPPTAFLTWVLSSGGASDYAVIGAAVMKAAETPPDDGAWHERWIEVLLISNQLVQQDEGRHPMDEKNGVAFRDWGRRTCKLLGQDVRNFPFCTSSKADA